MAQLVQSMRHSYDDLMSRGDPRVKDWLLMEGPIPTMAIVASYIYFVKYLGARVMKGREPFDLRNMIKWYNLALVFANGYIFWNVGVNGWFGKYSYKCQPVDYSDAPEAVAMAHLTWYFYFSKIIELMDTVFFVLRKKFNQISTLHVIHHSMLPIVMWWATKFVPGGHGTFTGLINSFVHIIMYSYYFLAALGPQMTPYLWWKKYLTTFQMTQFIILFFHSFQLYFRDCDYPKVFLWVIMAPATLFMFLFYDFYQKSYSNRAKKGSRKAEEKQNIKVNQRSG